MAQTSKKLPDGTLEITNTGDAVVSTMTRDEVVRKIEEVQTKIDHLKIDLVTAEADKTVWDKELEKIDA